MRRRHLGIVLWLCSVHHCSRLTPGWGVIDAPSYYLIGVLVEIVQKNDAGKWLGTHTLRRRASAAAGWRYILGPCWCTSTCQGQHPLEALQKLVEAQLYLFLTLGATILWALLFLAQSQLYCWLKFNLSPPPFPEIFPMFQCTNWYPLKSHTNHVIYSKTHLVILERTKLFSHTTTMI